LNLLFSYKSIVVFLLFFTVSSFSQNHSNAFIEKYENLLSANRDAVTKYSEELILSNDVTKNAFGLAAKAYEYVLLSDFASADTLFEQSFAKLATIEAVDVEVKSYILLLQGLRYVNSHELEIATQLLMEATENCNGNCSLVLSLKLQSTLARAYSLSGKVFKALEISHFCLKEIKKALETSETNYLKKEYAKELVKASNRCMNVYFYLDRETYRSYLDSAQQYINSAEKYAKRHQITTYDGNFALVNADINFNLRNYELCRQYMYTALDIYKERNYPKRIAQIVFRIAECDFFLNNYESAIPVFLKQIEEETWKEYELVDYHPLCHFYLFKIYKQRKESEKALAYANSYVKEIKTYLEAKNASLLAVNSAIEYEDRKKEIETYQTNFESQKEQKKVYLYLLLAAIICIGTLLTYFFRVKRRTKNNIQQLNSRVLQLQEAIHQQNLPKTNSLSDENALKLIQKLKKLEKEELFLQPNYTLAWVAKKLNTNSSYLSQTVNNYLNLSFAEYSNRLRIHSIVQRLEAQEHLRKYTIKALATEAGYKSIGSFNTNFKKLLKVKPSEYLKTLERTKNS
jgi:AraC-like DNA-binding protein